METNKGTSQLAMSSPPPGLSVAVLFFDGLLQTNDWIHGHLMHWKENVVVREPVTVVAGFHQVTNPNRTQNQRTPEHKVSASNVEMWRQKAKFASPQKTRCNMRLTYSKNSDKTTIVTSLGPHRDIDMEKIARNFILRRIRLGIKQSEVATTLRSQYGKSFSRTSLCRFEKLQLSRKKFYQMNEVIQRWLFETENGSVKSPTKELNSDIAANF